MRKPRAPGPPKTEANYRPPPTPQDQAMSTVHHADTSGFNLRHTGAHLDGAANAQSPDSERYNLSHAQRHAGEALQHVQALNDRLQEIPRFDTHYDPLGRQSGGGGGSEAPGVPEVTDSLNPPRVTQLHIMPITRDVGPSSSPGRGAGSSVMGDDGKGSLPRPFGRKAGKRPMGRR